MRRRSIQFLSIVLVLAMVLAAAGCGKKKTTTTTTTTTTTQATTTTTAASETTTAAASGLGALAANCKQLSDLGQAFSQAFQGANGDVQKQAQVLKEFADKTPSDIRPDFETLADAYTQIAGALKGVDLSSGKTPDAATLAKLMALSQKFQNAKFQAAVKHIETWAANNCHA
jgi:Flp pilus assembly protein TadD